MRAFLGVVIGLVLACGRPLDTFCISAAVTDRDHRNAYSYITTYRDSQGHTQLRLKHVPEKNYVTFQSARSKEVLNSREWYDRTRLGTKVTACYTNFEVDAWFSADVDTVARFSHITPPEGVERSF